MSYEPNFMGGGPAFVSRRLARRVGEHTWPEAPGKPAGAPPGRPACDLDAKSQHYALTIMLKGFWYPGEPWPKILHADREVGCGLLAMALHELTFYGKGSSADFRLGLRHPFGACKAALALATLVPDLTDGEFVGLTANLSAEASTLAAVARGELAPMPWLRTGPGGWEAWLTERRNRPRPHADLIRGFAWACALHTVPHEMFRKE